jgi:hypothetical protein|eukprot:SAG25_NODE_501_length_7358_cov_11.235156_4_plen_55_part_00
MGSSDGGDAAAIMLVSPAVTQLQASRQLDSGSHTRNTGGITKWQGCGGAGSHCL